MNGMYGMSDAERLIAVNHMQVAANHAVPSGAMPFQEVLRVYGEEQTTGIGGCIDYEKRKIKRIGKLRIHSVHHCYIDKDGQQKEFLYVSYSSMDDSTHLAVVPRDKLASKNLLPLFESFQWMCKSKAMANDYIAYCIRCFPPKSTQYFPEYAGFSFIEQSENSTFIQFDCNRKCFDMKLLKHCSPYFTKKVLPSIKDRPLGIKGICEKYLDTDKKMMLFVFSLCGLLSSFFREEKYSMERILTISAPDAASERFATLLMQIFNRGTKPLTLCSNKGAVKTELLHAKDETVILSDRSIIDDDKKRTEMLQYILTENDNMDCQPHNLAIFSTHAQYLLPPEKKICLTLPENFALAMTKEEEAEMCDDLNYLVNIIVSHICKNYELFRDEFKQRFIDIFNSEFEQYSPYFQGKSKEIIAAGAVLNTVYLCVINCILNFDSQPITPLIYSVLSDSQTVSGTSEDAVSEQFIAALNDAIRSGKLKILRHSKEMDFQEGTNQLIVKDKLLILEESAMENVLIPSMRTADNTCRILKCLKACEYLHATKKNRYPLVVYSHHRSLRPALIALKSDRILDSDVELMIEESRKNRMSLNFATQFLPKSTQVREIMDNAAIHAFFPLDDRTAASAAKLLNIDPQALTLLETGECYIKGTFYNQNRQKAIPGILHGTTYRNFKKAKPKLHKRPFIDVPCFDEKRCNFPPAKN